MSRRAHVIEVEPRGARSSRSSRHCDYDERDNERMSGRSSHSRSSRKYGVDYFDIRGPGYSSSSRSRDEYETREPRDPYSSSRSSRSRHSTYYETGYVNMHDPIYEIREPGRRSERVSSDRFDDYERGYEPERSSRRRHPEYDGDYSPPPRYEYREPRSARESRRAYEFEDDDDEADFSDLEPSYREPKSSRRSRRTMSPDDFDDLNEPVFETRVPGGSSRDSSSRHSRRPESHEKHSKPSRSSRKPARHQGTTFTKAQATAWYEKCKPILKGGTAAKTTFPEPPAYDCSRTSCQGTEGSRAIKQCCKHGIQDLFRLLDVNVKKERLLWHPDRWSAVKNASKQEELKAKASEVFVALNTIDEKEDEFF